MFVWALVLSCRAPREAAKSEGLKTWASASAPRAMPAAQVGPSAFARETKPPPTAPPSELPAPSAWPPKPPEGITTDFCISLVDALDEETCYALPNTPTDELLVYLHGTLPPTRTSAQKTSFQTVVATASRRANVAALIPRGRRGLAAKGQAGFWGWPTTAGAQLRLVRELVQSFEDKRRKLEALTKTRFSRVYLAGSSSGAYFVAALALQGAFEADGFAAISGGSATSLRELATLKPTPFYVGFGRHDPVGTAATSLAKHLGSARWPVKVSVHPLPHGTSEIYLDEAFAFWRQAARAPAAPGPRNEAPAP